MRSGYNKVGFFCVLGLFFCLAGCAFFSPKTKLIELPGVVNVHLQTTQNANNNSPIAVSLVLVYDKKLFSTVKALSAKKWYASYRQLLYDNPRGLIIKNWELMPGQLIHYSFNPERRKQIVGILVFANYTDKGQYRQGVFGFSTLNVFLKEKTFSLKTIV